MALAAAVQGEEAQSNGQLLQVPPMAAFQAAAAPAAAPPPPSTADIVALLQQVLRGQHELRAISENVPRRMRNSRVADGAAVLRPLCRERVSQPLSYILSHLVLLSLACVLNSAHNRTRKTKEQSTQRTL